MLVELAVDEALPPAPERVEILANARFADVHAVEGNLDRAVVGEKARNLVPEAAIDVVTISGLQPFDRVDVLDALFALLERCDARCERIQLRGFLGARPAAPTRQQR